MNRIALLASIALFAGCADNPTYQGPTTKQTANLGFSVTGIEKHSAYPNDIVWLQLYRPGGEKPFGAVKLTVDNPDGQIVLDAGSGVAYAVRFVSQEAQFGGATNCAAVTDLTPLAGESYRLSYNTQKSTCSVTTDVRHGGSGNYVRVSTRVGSVGGVQYRATIQPGARGH